MPGRALFTYLDRTRGCLLAIFAAACLAAGGCISLPEVPDETSVYRVKSNETTLMQTYDGRLRRWPVAFDTFYVETSYGPTHITACGPAGGEPVMLLHDMGLNGTMWLPNVGPLSRDYRIYAVDTIGDLGRSRLYDHECYPRNGREMSEWLMDVFRALGVERATLVGSSMGGWIAINAAVHAPESVTGLVLLGPVGLRSPREVLFKLFYFLLMPTESNRRKMVAWTLGDDPVVRAEFEDYMMTALDCRGNLPIPRTISDKHLRSIQAPVLLLLGEDDGPVPDAREIRARAERLIPNVGVVILPETGHLMNVEEADLVNRRMLAFLER